MMTLANRKFLSLMLVTVFALMIPLNARADAPFLKPWTTVGSAGTVDEADANEVLYTNATVSLKPATPAQTVAVIRYNVVAVDGLADPAEGYRMKVAFRDTGANDQVIVQLKSVEINTGALATLMTFNSNAFAAAPVYGVQSVIQCPSNWKFDFNRYAYYVEATLIKYTTAGNPALTAVQIGRC